MKALTYTRAHPLNAFAMELVEVGEPQLRADDVLVEIRAIAVNPGEAFIRSVRSAEPGGQAILGWEFAGVVVRTGTSAKGFTVGDRVMGTGDITRDGCWAQQLAGPSSGGQDPGPALFRRCCIVADRRADQLGGDVPRSGASRREWNGS